MHSHSTPTNYSKRVSLSPKPKLAVKNTLSTTLEKGIARMRLQMPKKSCFKVHLVSKLFTGFQIKSAKARPNLKEALIWELDRWVSTICKHRMSPRPSHKRSTRAEPSCNFGRAAYLLSSPKCRIWTIKITVYVVRATNLTTVLRTDLPN